MTSTNHVQSMCPIAVVAIDSAVGVAIVAGVAIIITVTWSFPAILIWSEDPNIFRKGGPACQKDTSSLYHVVN